MKERKLGLWNNADCDECGDSFLATRTQERIVKAGERLVCDDCEMYGRGYRDGYRSGLAALRGALTSLLDEGEDRTPRTRFGTVEYTMHMGGGREQALEDAYLIGNEAMASQMLQSLLGSFLTKDEDGNQDREAASHALLYSQSRLQLHGLYIYLGLRDQWKRDLALPDAIRRLEKLLPEGGES